MFWTKAQKNTIWDQDIDGPDIFAILGNINVGKETLLEGLIKNAAQEQSYPDANVKLKYGKVAGTEHLALNVPGEFVLTAENEDEAVAKRVFLEKRANKIIFVADAKDLKNSLALFFHFSELGLPMIFNINMIDQAQLQGIDIDVKKLEKILGTQVNTSIAIERMGVNNLRNLLDSDISKPKQVEYPKILEEYFTLFDKLLPEKIPHARQLALSLLVGDKVSKDYINATLDEACITPINNLVNSTKKRFKKRISTYLYDIYLNRAEEVFNEVTTTSPAHKLSLENKFGIWSRNLSTGIPIAIVIVSIMFMIVGKFGAEYFVGLTEGTLFGEIINPYVENFLTQFNSPFLSDMIVGEFGLLSVGITLPLGLVAPVLLTFYFCFNLLESSGYLPRLAILFDRIFKKMGMSGKGVIPLMMGFSCITMAIITTRVLDTKKERNIATFLLLLGIPCAPLFGMMMVLLADMPASAYLFLFGIITSQILLIGYLMNKIFKNQQSNFIFNVPPLQTPSLKAAFFGAFRQSYFFLKEALPVFIYATFIVFILDQFGMIKMLENVCKPLLSGFMGLPIESTSVFILSIIRREAGVALLKQFADANVFNNVQIIINLLLVTFLMPCINALLVVVKERGIRIALSMATFTITYAILMGGILNVGFSYFGITF